MRSAREVIGGLSMLDGVIENLSVEDGDVILEALNTAGYVVVAKDRIETLEAALREIASCEKRADGDVVDIARRALEGKS